MVKNLSANSGDVGSVTGLGRFPGEGNGKPLQYACLGNPMDRGTWHATLYGVTKESDTTVTKQEKRVWEGMEKNPIRDSTEKPPG